MIEIKNLYKEYYQGNNPFLVLKGIDLYIQSGEFVSIMGPSGSGKSTLLNILGCLDREASGSYFLNTHNIFAIPESELDVIRNQHVGFVFQHFNLLSTVNVKANVELPLIYNRIKRAVRERKVRRILMEVGLEDYSHRMPNELSGGEKQRVAIARALVNGPNIIIADEPTGNLDSQNGRNIMKLFQRLNDSGITIILVTHDEEISSYSNREILIKDGVIAEDKGEIKWVSGRV